MSLKFYEIAGEYRAIDAMLDESGGELTPEIEARLDAIGGTLEAKADAVCGLVKEALAAADALAEEAGRLRERAAAGERKADRLKALLLQALKASGKDRVKTARFTAWQARAGTPSITWEGDPDQIPADFRRHRVELDGRAAAAAYKAGGSLPDGFRVRHTEYLGIR